MPLTGLVATPRQRKVLNNILTKKEKTHRKGGTYAKTL